MAVSAELNGAAAPFIMTAKTAEEPWTVEGVLSTIPGGPPAEQSTSPVPFFGMLQRLKTTKREGWRRFGIDRGESIADHMYRMSLMTMFAPASLAPRLNVAHCMKMALIHDMAEALVGDITPVDGVSKVEKNRREASTMDYFTKTLLGKVNGGITGKEINDIWQEYEDSDTLESKYVHDIDKMELILQMIEYEKAHDGEKDLGEFSWVASRIQLPEVQAWSEEVLKEREEFWSKVGKPHTTFTDRAKPEKAEHVAKADEYYGNGTAK